ncbi:MAG: PKD domain-containing protein [Taibaiella sp.]|nr:PKD domain-containing protein [Taibaiella sp.]
MPRNIKNIALLLFLWFCPALTHGAVTAGFTVDNASGCVPLIVHFTNTSTDAVSYSWNLGNSTTSTVSDPSASYFVAGNYTVTLTAINGAATSTYSMVITVYPLPSVSFNAASTSLCPGVPVVFNNTSTGGTPGPVSYVWNFGDGSTSTVAAPTYTHAAPGFYNITLFASNSMGCSKSLTLPSYIQVYTPPVVNFSGSGTFICQPPSLVPFTNATSGTLPLSYNWSFGDGSISGATNPVYNYTTPGNYDVRLRVTDGNGCIDSLLSPGYVYVGGLDASFSAPPSICQFLPVPFTNSSTPFLSCYWDFGDGFTSTDEVPSYAFSTPGTYNVQLIVFDGSCYDTVVHPITIHANPTATFTITPTVPCPVPVTVNYTATVPPGCTTSWLFMDNTTGAGATVNHTYPSGSLGARFDTVVLTVTNSNGCTIKVEKKDTLYNVILNINATAPAGCIPLTTSFIPLVLAESYNPLTEEFIVMPFPYTVSSYSWNFGDGSPVVTGPSPSHTYSTVGSFTATCTMTTSAGCVRTKTQVIKTGVPPVASFTATPTPAHICAGKPIHFSASGSSTINSYFWKYGDGTVDSGTSYTMVTHTYLNPIVDTIRLRGYHNGCGSPEVILPVRVDSPNAVPSFSMVCVPRNRVVFGDASIGADSRLWIFGDGDTSSAPIVTHDFPALTSYDVRLTTYNANSGCRDTVHTEVKLAPPLMYLVAADTTICIHEETTLFPFVIGPPDATHYRWYIDGILSADGVEDIVSLPFNTPGLHDIRLVIVDDQGCLDTFTRNDYVLTGNPTDSFTSSPPAGCGPLSVNFIDHSTAIPESPLASYEWNFGDGSSPLVSTVPGAAHTYTAAGSYNVSLTVTDTLGCTSTTSPPEVVNVYRPHASFYADFNNVCLGESVHFNNLSTGIISSFWIYGDGNTSTAVSPYHVYTTSGVYTVKLVVTDGNGCPDTSTLINYIYVAPSPVASFSMSDSFAVCPPLNVNFTNTSTSAVSYSWNFGNSTSSVAVNPSSPYIASGYYPVRLVAFNTIGCTDTLIRHVNVFGYSGAFSYTPISGCMPLPVHFCAALGSIASLVWDFGDGITSSVSLSDTISHTYSTQGLYIPKLILTDTSGCTNFSAGTDTIKVDIVTPNFRINPNPVCQGSAVVFTDSSYASFAPPASWAWSFGGGATATGSTPVHTFTMSGTHAVTMAVTNGNGCTASVLKNVTVNTIPASITGVRTVCVGLTTLLGNSTSGGVWSSSTPAVATISSGGLVSGNSAGTSAITYSLSAGCIATAIVTVYPLPGTISGTSITCAGNNTTLSSSTTGGTWSSSVPAIGSVHVTSGVVTGLSGGTGIITYTLGTGCITTRGFTVNPTPAPITGTMAVCVNATTTLLQSMSGGTWISSNLPVATIDAGGIVTGIAAGTTQITYSFASGCLAQTVVTVNPLPDTITGNAALCNGALTALFNSTTGGTWSSADPFVAVVHPTIGTVFGMSVGTTTISYTIATGCKRTKVVTVNVIPGPITGVAGICVNTTTTLYQSVPGGTWSSSNIPVATIDAGGVVTGNAAGTATITYSFGSGCYTTTVVTINPLPDTIAGNPGLCIGLTTFLSNSMAGGTWSSSDVSVAPINTGGVVSALSLGTSIISYTLSTGCAKGVIVTVNPLPDAISGISNVCIANPTLLTNTTPGGTWLSGNTSVATIDMYSGVFNGVGAGVVMVTYTSTAGCIATKMLTVEALPPVIAGGPTVCAGFSVNLSNSMPGGVWSSDPAAAGVGTIHPFTGVVTGITPGTVSISYTIMTGCMRELLVTVLVLPAPISGSPTVCAGDTTYLSNTTPGGTWTSSNPARAVIDASTGAMAGISAGTAVITYRVSSGCFNVLTITVNPIPAAIAGLSNVCEGATIGLFNTTPSGVWISSNTSTATVGAATGIVTGILAGTTTITYSLASGCKVTKGVTVDATPPAITGNPHVCIGTSVTLANAMPGGSWSSSNTGIASVGSLSGVVGSVTLGTVYISYIMPVTGCAAVRLVTVQPLPAVYNVLGGGNYCAGGPGRHVRLSGSQPGVSYALYYGSSATGYLAGSGFLLDFGAHMPAGVYTVQATNVTSGCTRDMAGSVTISITPLVTPVVTIMASPDDTTCPGNSVTVSPVSLHSGTMPLYLWKVNGTIVSSAASYSFVPAHADVVSLTMTSNADCLAATEANAVLTLTVLPSELPMVNVLVSPGDTVCQHGTATYMAMPSFGGVAPAYRWIVNGFFAGVGSVYSFVPQQGDVVYCVMASDYLCPTADTVVSGSIVMQIDTLVPPQIILIPEPGLSVYAGQPVTLRTSVNNAGPAPRYQWRVNGVPVPGATNDSYTAVFDNQDSVVCVVNSSGVCEGIASFDWVFISVYPLTVQQASNTIADIRLVPNPNNGRFSITGTIGADRNEDIAVSITDMLGQVVYEGVLTAKGGKVDETLTLSNNLANGMYMLRLGWGSERLVFHFVIRQ